MRGENRILRQWKKGKKNREEYWTSRKKWKELLEKEEGEEGRRRKGIEEHKKRA